MRLSRDIFLVIVGILLIGVLVYERTSEITNESPAYRQAGPRPITPVFELPEAPPLVVQEPVPEPIPEPTQESPPITPTAKEEVKPKFSTDELYTRGLTRMVNLLCNAPKNQVIVVSGFLISDKGHILTNAHLSDKLVPLVDPLTGLEEKRCEVRRGSPARAFATAEEIFKPAGYERGSGINEKARYDIAIWKIIAADTSFTAFNLDPENGVVGETLVVLSYPSELLGYQTILLNLTLFSTLTRVTETDGTITASSQTLSSQMGSSGGAMLSALTGEPVGIIFGVGESETINERVLYSITAAAVNRIIFEETGQTLAEFLAAN